MAVIQYNLPIKNSFFQGTAVYMVANMVNAAIPFMLLPIMTRILSPEEYGQVAMFQVLIGFLGAIVGLNVVGAAARKFYDDNSRSLMKKYITTCLYIIILSGVFIFFLLFFLKNVVGLYLNIKSEWVLLCVIVAFFMSISQLRLEQWVVRKNAIKYALLQIIQSLLVVLLSIVLVVFLEKGVLGRILAQVIGVVLGGLVAFFSLSKDGLVGLFGWRLSFAKEALCFGVPLIPHVAGGFLLVAVDRLIINTKLGLSDVGVYTVAVQFSSVMVLIFDAINKAFVPWLFERLKADVFSEKCNIVRYTYLWFGAILVGVCLVFLVGPRFIVWVVGEKYADSASLIGWLALGQGFFGMYRMVANYIFYSRKTALLSLTTVLSGLLNVVLLVLFLRFFGVKGASLAFCFAMGFRFLVSWVVAQKEHPMPWFSFNAK